MLRGVFEFIGNTLLLLALKIALENQINQGISTSMMTLAGMMLTLMSWCFYDEKLNRVQLIGISILLLAVAMMGVFQVNEESG